MKTLILVFSLISLGRSDWSDSLAEGGIEGYLTPTNASSFLTSLPSNKYQLKALATTSKNNQLPHFLLSSKAGSKTANPTILITASHTTSQPFSATMALFTAGYLSQNSSDLANFLRSYFSIIVVPMVNIDAFYNMTNENNTLRVFLKNFHEECGNFGFEFGVNATDQEKNSCNDSYQGAKEFSEVETAAIRDLLAKNNVFIWMHFDGLKDQVVVPWTYSSKLKDFGSQYLNDSYAELQDVLKEVKVNNSANLGLGSFGGSFVDYGASLGVFSLQFGFASSVLPKSEILNSCKKYNENIIKVLKASIKSFQVSGPTWNVSEEETQNNVSSVRVTVEVTAKNPSKLNLSAVLFMEYNNTSGNLTLEELDTQKVEEDANSTSRFRSLSEDNHALVLQELSETTIKTIILVKGDPGDFFFDLSLQLKLAGSSDSNSYSVLDSNVLTIEKIEGVLPTAGDSGGSGGSGGASSPAGFISYRSWHRSAGHHEGVAVGLVTFFVSVLLILVVLYVVRLYKNLPETDEEEEPSSDFVKREVKTVKSHENFSPDMRTPDRSFDQKSGFKGESSPLRVAKDSEPVKTISIPVNVQKFAIDEDERRAASPVINVPNRPKNQVKSPEPDLVKKSSPKAIYSTPSFTSNAEVPVIKSSGPVMKKTESPEVNLRALAPMDYGNVPEFNPKNEVRQVPPAFVASREEPPARPSDNKRPSGTVVVKGSDSEDEIEILHAPDIPTVGTGAPSGPAIYKPYSGNSDDGEFGIMPVSESAKAQNFTPGGSVIKSLPNPPKIPTFSSNFSGLSPAVQNPEASKPSSGRSGLNKSSKSSSSESSSSDSSN